MTTLHLTRGLPASGKTTFALNWLAADRVNRVRINRDDLRMMLSQRHAGLEPYQEMTITAMVTAGVREALSGGHDVIVDNTHLRLRDVRAMAKLADELGCDFELHDFNISVEEAVRRDAARDRSVGRDVIERMAKYLVKGKVPPFTPSVSKDETITPYVPREGAPHAIMVDIDGTVALHEDRRSPYDMSLVSQDAPNHVIIDVVKTYMPTHRIVMCSGRNEIARADSEAWLRKYGIEFDALFMRADGDTRGDNVVKRELFDEHIRDAYAVDFVLDDRQQVVDMWRSLGLTCLQVAPGDF